MMLICSCSGYGFARVKSLLHAVLEALLIILFLQHFVPA
jgi:hypothetical protein